MRCLALAPAAVLAAVPALADPAADYVRLLQLMPLAEARDPERSLAYAEGLVSHLAGSWVNLDVLFDGRGEAAYDADLVGKACGRSTLTLTPASPFSLGYANGNDKGRMTGQLQWAGGNAFIGVYDEASMRARFFGSKAATVEGGPLFSALVHQALSGRLTILPAGEDIMVILHEGTEADIWARCPA
jgi:hypothetical protein